MLSLRHGLHCVELVRSGRYKEAAASIGTNQCLRSIVIAEMLGKRSSYIRVGSEYKEVLARLTSDAIEDRHLCSFILDLICSHFFPKDVSEFWETFIEQGLVDKNKFMTNMHIILKRRLYDLLLEIDRSRSSKKPVDELKLRLSFGRLFLTSALKPSHGDSVSCCLLHGSADCSSHTDLFSKAVSLGLLSEAVLLYDTGSVCPKHLAALAKEANIQKMLTGDDSSPMAAFLRQVVNRPPSMKFLCRVQLAKQLGDDLKGKMDRARSLGLPPSLCEGLVNLHQTKQFVRSVNEECADKVNEEETEIVQTMNRSVADLALRELIDF